jgi:hypothetical protein
MCGGDFDDGAGIERPGCLLEIPYQVRREGRVFVDVDEATALALSATEIELHSGFLSGWHPVITSATQNAT